MGNRQIRFYFETSAVNSFAKSHTIEDAIATKAFQNVRGRGWYISPVVLWEIMLTSKELDREKLLFFAQHLFEPNLLPSPEELIISYISSGCPLVEKEYRLVSTGVFSDAWRDICRIKEKTLIYDLAQIKQATKVLREVGKLLHTFLTNDTINITEKPDITGYQVTTQRLLDHYKLVPDDLKDVKEAVRHFRLVVFLISIILCAGISIEGQIIQEFWNKKGFYQTKDRIEYIFSKYPILVTRGPFQQIAHMMYYQSGGSFSRGIFFDSLHTIYSIYADIFLTADDHFRIFRDNLKENFPTMSKILHIDEVQWVSTEREILPRDSFLLKS